MAGNLRDKTSPKGEYTVLSPCAGHTEVCCVIRVLQLCCSTAPLNTVWRNHISMRKYSAGIIALRLDS